MRAVRKSGVTTLLKSFGRFAAEFSEIGARFFGSSQKGFGVSGAQDVALLVEHSPLSALCPC